MGGGGEGGGRGGGGEGKRGIRGEGGGRDTVHIIRGSSREEEREEKRLMISK